MERAVSYIQSYKRKVITVENILNKRNLPAFMSEDEMLEILLREEYGYMPPAPQSVKFEIYEKGVRERFSCFCAGKAYYDKVNITSVVNGKEFTFPISVITPTKEGKYPFFVNINFSPDVPDKYLPIEEIIDNGFAVLSFCNRDVTADDKDFTNGLAGVLFPDGKRGPHDSGKIAMWAWAMQRVMDYAQTLDVLDKDCAVACGHSRLGKTALLCVATDKRFKFVYSNDSGCCGAAITRDKVGEGLDFITDTFSQWFCEDFKKYVGKEHEMPFDQHYLAALCYPANLLIGSAYEDEWADPTSEMLCAVSAGKYYESKGKKGLVYDGNIAKPGDKFLEGNVGYHVREGLHYFSREDWHRLIEFVNIHK